MKQTTHAMYMLIKAYRSILSHCFKNINMSTGGVKHNFSLLNPAKFFLSVASLSLVSSVNASVNIKQEGASLDSSGNLVISGELSWSTDKTEIVSIAPLTFDDDEFRFIYIDDKGICNYQNKRKSSIFKRVDKDGTIVINDIDAFTKRIKYHKGWNDNKFEEGNNTAWSGGTWIVNKEFKFTGDYLTRCKIKQVDINTHKYHPQKTIILNCYEIGNDDGIKGFTNFVRNDSPEFIQLCKQYELDTVHVESIKGDSVFDITPLDIDIAEKELKNNRN